MADIKKKKGAHPQGKNKRIKDNLPRENRKVGKEAK